LTNFPADKAHIIWQTDNQQFLQIKRLWVINGRNRQRGISASTKAYMVQTVLNPTKNLFFAAEFHPRKTAIIKKGKQTIPSTCFAEGV
jgi:hypothetical protein